MTAALCLLLAAVIGIVDWPAVWHLPHSDQSNFFLDTIEHDGFFDLVAHTYSFTRTRVHHPGDTQLFRPILFVWLSGLQAFLGLRWEFCQVLSIVLHIAVCVLFFLLLQHIFARSRPAGASPAETDSWARWRSPFTWLPFAIVFFYGLNYALIEQVIWYHIQPYMLAMILILGSMLLLVYATAPTATAPAPRGRLLAGAWVLALLATFTYELGQFFAVCASLFLVGTPWANWRRRWLTGVAFVAITVAYQGINHLDRCHHAGTYKDDIDLPRLLHKACDVATLEHAARYALYTTVQPFLPCRIYTHAYGKVFIAEHLWNGGLKPRPRLILGAVVFGLWAGLILLGTIGLPRRSTSRALAVGGLLAGTGLAQAAMIVLGRMNMRPGPISLSYNSHYTYFGLLFALAVAALAMAQAQQAQSRLRRVLAHGLAGLLAAGLIVLGTRSACTVYQLNTRMAETFGPSWSWVRSLRDFVSAHCHEPDFRFAVAWNRQEVMPQNGEIPMPFVFYRRYIDCDHPKYVLWYQHNTFVGVPVEEWRQKHPQGTPHFCPNFVRLGRVYQIFCRDGLYYAISGGQLRPFLASCHPEREKTFRRERDLLALLHWVEAVTP